MSEGASPSVSVVIVPDGKGNKAVGLVLLGEARFKTKEGDEFHGVALSPDSARQAAKRLLEQAQVVDNGGFGLHFQGARAQEGKVAVVGNLIFGERVAFGPVFFTPQYAQNLGCMFIELGKIAQEREDELISSGATLDVAEILEEFAFRITERFKLNNVEVEIKYKND
jgi:hypothetical protein